MRIAMISTPFVPVPPPTYGGTELVVSELTSGLSALGQDVVLFATGDSRPACASSGLFPRALWPPATLPELVHAAWAFEQVLADPLGFDVVHAHVPTALALARLAPALPVVYTLHHARDVALGQLYERAPPNVQLVAISGRQRALQPGLSRCRVVHHGLDPARYRFGPGSHGYLAFLGRLSREKGHDTAIDVARHAGKPVQVAGSAHEDDQEFLATELAPRLELPGVRHLGELDHERKVALLEHAEALLFPVRWEEPFGLVMIEAMLCGTPVVAFRGGAVEEVVEPGRTGFIAEDPDDMVRIVIDRLPHLSRAGVRARAVERFSTVRMVRSYLDVYRAARERGEGVAAGEEAPA